MERSKVTSAFLLTVIIAVFILAFLFLDFRAAISETKAESRVINASSDNLLDPLKVDLSSGIYVYVVEDDDLTHELRYLLIRNLSEKWNGILEINNLKKNYDRQVLIVTLHDREISYNPFFPSARVEIIVL